MFFLEILFSELEVTDSEIIYTLCMCISLLEIKNVTINYVYEKIVQLQNFAHEKLGTR